MLEHVERFVAAGYELRVDKYYDGKKILARVWLGITESSHNYLGNTVDDALTGLNVYLAPLRTGMGSPNPTGAPK